MGPAAACHSSAARHQELNQKRGHSWEYVPFSGGPRICIGQQFALTMMSYLTARFFQVFESIEAADDAPMVQQASTTISLVNGCWVKLTPVGGAA